MFETSDTEISNDSVVHKCSSSSNTNNNDDIIVNNNYELRFPYSIKSVDPLTDEQLLRDFTGILIHYFAENIHRECEYRFVLELLVFSIC